MKIGWAFTGAGHLLKESVEAMEELAKDNDLTVFLSQASEEVLKMYGLYDMQAIPTKNSVFQLPEGFHLENMICLSYHLQLQTQLLR